MSRWCKWLEGVCPEAEGCGWAGEQPAGTLRVRGDICVDGVRYPGAANPCRTCWRAEENGGTGCEFRCIRLERIRGGGGKDFPHGAGGEETKGTK